MKRLFTLLTLLICFQMSQAQEFHFKKDHDALLVKNVSLSAEFYAKVFNIKEIYSAGLGEKYRWFALTDDVQIHLIESTDAIEKHKGIHMAINTDNLEGFMQHLRKIKVPFENWQGVSDTTNTRPDGVKQIYIQDPDGYWIEINDNKLH